MVSRLHSDASVLVLNRLLWPSTSYRSVGLLPALQDLAKFSADGQYATYDFSSRAVRISRQVLPQEDDDWLHRQLRNSGATRHCLVGYEKLPRQTVTQPAEHLRPRQQQCQYCGKRFPFGLSLTTSCRAQAGASTWENIVLRLACNVRKGRHAASPHVADPPEKSTRDAELEAFL